MGLDLYALKPRVSFNQDELNDIIKKEKDIDNRYEVLSQYGEKICMEQYGMSIEDFLATYSEDAAEQDKFFDQGLMLEKRKELDLISIEESNPYDEGSTNSRILNYYFKHCDSVHWREYDIKINKKLLKDSQEDLEKDRAAFNATKSPKENNTMEDLQVHGCLIYPENLEEAKKRFMNRQYISISTLQIVTMMNKHPDCIFAFL